MVYFIIITLIININTFIYIIFLFLIISLIAFIK
jgi:hypothetical protein